MSQGSDWAQAAFDGFMGRLRDSRAVLLATTGTMDEVAERVWGRGELTDGGKLAYKEDYEVYGYKPPAPRKPSGLGKPNKDGKRRKIKGGWHPTYLSFKEQQGRADLPFELTGSLRQDWLGGATPTPVSVDERTAEIRMSREQWAKAEGLAKQKGEFLKWNDTELENWRKRFKTIMADGS